MTGNGAERDECVMDAIFRAFDETGLESISREDLVVRIDSLDPEQANDSVDILAARGQITRKLFFGGGWLVTGMSDHEILKRYEAKGIDVGAEQRRLLKTIDEQGSVSALDTVPDVLVRTIIRVFLGRNFIQGSLMYGGSFAGHLTATGRRWLEEQDELTY
ncbi:hypothetical protein [Arthrobacter sp. MMS18-M83]|uniref:hypothetical protein n=1 Tax=Arthrobacter sp. MMS18-M83 TaxID=2996261 RepID=UPI00227CAEDE|nr:hypothetical protein [Arthrobacter sp. MMS18-M83]WAH98132.1 hypothetical protein OW521_04420 [Arthrobacter sp. MMS18-M83]